jgi:hypothetical protein
VKLLPNEKEVISSCSRNVSESAWTFLQTDRPEIPSALQSELSSITSDITSATRKVLALVKYALGCIDLDEQLLSFKSVEWSADKTGWKPFPTLVKGVADAYSTHHLNQQTAHAIQQCIDRGFEPFVALRHLHKARIERIPHYKWIDATIAAELAIKEFLIRLKPEIATLLLEMPSPPLHKLYGSVLESFGVQRSPKVKEIQKGVEIRNKLVHRPGEAEISLEDANAYVHDIEDAIYHLIVSLYPDDSNIGHFYYAFRFQPTSDS